MRKNKPDIEYPVIKVSIPETTSYKRIMALSMRITKDQLAGAMIKLNTPHPANSSIYIDGYGSDDYRLTIIEIKTNQDRR